MSSQEKIDEAIKAYKTVYWWAFLNAEECGLLDLAPDFDAGKIASMAVMAAIEAVRNPGT